jgi:hypothetical protein
MVVIVIVRCIEVVAVVIVKGGDVARSDDDGSDKNDMSMQIPNQESLSLSSLLGLGSDLE